MKRKKLYTRFRKYLGDTYTPVSIYLKLRDKLPNSILLESSDYHGHENSFSFICCSPLAGISIQDKQLTRFYTGSDTETCPVEPVLGNVSDLVEEFAASFDTDPSPFPFPTGGLFGYTAYDAVPYFENIQFKTEGKTRRSIPDMIYRVYRFVLVIDHFRDELYVFEHSPEQEDKGGIERILGLIANKNIPDFHFNRKGMEESNFSDGEYKEIVSRGKEHCRLGDVFQVVFSREFSQAFQGDEFNVYRALRSVNPSPYLFYFDFGSFKLFGSSPEAQLIIKNGIASIHPIAGTFKRTGDDKADALLAEELKLDPKENAEHTMLVDLARNDLSRDCSGVKVETFREVQFYSHVIHLVSCVTGRLKAGRSTFSVVANTFPAGTLSGAPKHMAMQLIDRYEKGRRGFYGGCIGMLGFNGDFNHAIMIRSFLSKDNRLFYQAGAGIVESSSEENELREVYNKLAALKKAIELAETI